MKPEQWNAIRAAALGETLEKPPVALIIDSPWIPGFLGISSLDYLMDPEVWLRANLEVEDRFPEIAFLPGFWAEMGMCAEPSGFGCKMRFFADRTPDTHSLTDDIEVAAALELPNPATDGLMPVILNQYRKMEPRVREAGHVVKMVAARGPLTLAVHLMGVTDFLMALKTEPEPTHRFLKMTTTLVRNWLEAQAEALDSIESVLVLDDIAGFLSLEDYLEFAHPYLKEVFDAFPNAIKFFHNDTDNPDFVPPSPGAWHPCLQLHAPAFTAGDPGEDRPGCLPAREHPTAAGHGPGVARGSPGARARLPERDFPAGKG